MSSVVKKIHYCWFGGSPLPQSAKKCIDSWKKYLPEYEIIEWNESNFDVNSCRFSSEAYKSKKWAFVSDYARFKILYEYGGIYFDTDVEVINSLDDILERGAFMACEGDNVAAGLGIYAEPKNPVYGEIIDNYENSSFILEDGSQNIKTVVTIVTDILNRKGFDRSTANQIQIVEGIRIYPSEYFCPLNFSTRQLDITPNTRTIHHYDNSWYDDRMMYWQELKLKLNKLLPIFISERIALIVSLIKFEGISGTIRYFKRKGN